MSPPIPFVCMGELAPDTWLPRAIRLGSARAVYDWLWHRGPGPWTLYTTELGKLAGEFFVLEEKRWVVTDAAGATALEGFEA